MKISSKIAKGILSSCERHAFSVRYDAFRKVKDGLLQVKIRLFLDENDGKQMQKSRKLLIDNVLHQCP
jgi:hypothetical protein